MLTPDYQITQAVDLIPTGYALSIGLMLPVVFSIFYSLGNALRPLNIIIFGIFFWLIFDIVQGSYTMPGVPVEAISDSVSAIVIFSLALLTGYGIASGRSIDLKPVRITTPDASGIFALVVICSFLGSLGAFLSCGFSPLCLIDGIFAPRFESAWQQADIGRFDTLLYNFRLMGLGVPSLLILFHSMERRLSWRIFLAGLLALLYIILLLQSGDRRYIGLAAISAVVTWSLLHWPLRWRNAVAILSVVVLLALLLNITVQVRHAGWRSYFNVGVEDWAHNKAPIMKVDTNFRFLSHIVDIVPEHYAHTGLSGVYANVAAPLPRSLLPNKPILHAFPIRWFVPGLPRDSDWSWTCSAVCDFYLIGGNWAVVIGGLLFGLFANILSRWCWESPGGLQTVFFSLLVMTIFVGLRAIRELVILGLAFGFLWCLVSIVKVLVRESLRHGSGGAGVVGER